MGQYKDMSVPDDLVDVIAHMKEVDSYREELTILGQAWDLLTILGRMSGGRTDMTSIREDFRLLTEKLIGSLGQETLSKTILDISSKAQVTIDIIIRNLFERTADIGFLATDDDLRKYLRQTRSFKKSMRDLDNIDQETASKDHAQQTAALISRFREYVAKYSVYHNIILLDTNGDVLAQLDENNPITKSNDPLIKRALTTQDDYIETFSRTDLQPDADQALIYSYRVTESNAPGSEALGVLCLCFRFENEMQGIFENLTTADDWSVLTLMDDQGQIIASSSPNQVPVGAKLESATNAEYKVVKFAGRRYIAKTLDTKGYQGFYGLGWKGHVMMPIDVAFENNSRLAIQSVDEQILDSILKNPRLFSEEIQNIPIEAEKIQTELDRTVWNGNISSENRNDGDATSASKVLLWEISRTGMKTKNVFARAIQNLHETVVTTYLNDVEFMASLAIDIMDRNLYERANDCRWWALTSEFKRILSLKNIDENEAEKASQILAYINNLYTVYTNLFLYSKSGKIIAVSNPAENHLVGHNLNESWVSNTLKLHNSQHYCVSSFDQTPLYDNRHTYIYSAAINPENSDQQAVGGIGIVFDSEPEFKAMLMDSLPRNSDGELVAGCFAVFVDKKGRVIAATRDDLKPGEVLEINLSMLNITDGESESAIIAFNGAYYAVGLKSSRGYREYKSQKDTYKNPVFSLVFMELDKVGAHEDVKSIDRLLTSSANTRPVTQNYTEIATFYIDGQWFGVDANEVIEAIEFDNVQPIPGTENIVVGTRFYKGKPITVINPSELLGANLSVDSEHLEIIIMKTTHGEIGVLVERLGEIPRIENERLERNNSLLSDAGLFIKSIVSPASNDAHDPMLIILSPSDLMTHLTHDVTHLSSELT